MKTILRAGVVVLVANGLGYGFFRLAGWFATQLWEQGPAPDYGTVIWRICITAIAFSTPPVIIAALAARVAGRYEPWVGLGSALWGLSARLWWPASVPLLPPESWVAPMSLILISGLIGGWMVSRHPPVMNAVSPTATAESSKDSVT
jgi:hypothetical protein